LAIVGIIPARHGSKRLPGKPLSDTQGRKLMERVRAGACAAGSLDRVMLGNDDERIRAAARSRGRSGRSVFFDQLTGGDPMAEVAGATRDGRHLVAVSMKGRVAAPAPRPGRGAPAAAAERKRGMAADTPEDLGSPRELPPTRKGRLA
jgi:3-deoxy-manno-octulosonate cytidylyltransferase (CMP-KDO synthetase)